MCANRLATLCVTRSSRCGEFPLLHRTIIFRHHGGNLTRVLVSEMLARTRDRIAALSLQLADYPRVQNAYLGLMKQIKPPPYREDNMETVTGSWLGASSARCAEGRQFGENNVSPAYYRERCYETTVGKLGGSRAGCPINTSALRSVLRNWNDAIEIIDFLRSRYIDRLGLQGKPLSYVDLYVLSNIGTSIPAYLLRRHANPVPSGRIPSPVGATYRWSRDWKKSSPK